MGVKYYFLGIALGLTPIACSHYSQDAPEKDTKHKIGAEGQPKSGDALPAQVSESTSVDPKTNESNPKEANPNESTSGAIVKGIETNPCYKAVEESCMAEAEVLRLLNLERAKSELDPLKIGTKLSFGARQWSQEQANARSISHSGFPQLRTQVIISEFASSSVKLVAENVAMFFNLVTPVKAGENLFSIWQKSPPHLKNMMGSYSHIGIGIIKVNNEWYGTQIFGTEE